MLSRQLLRLIGAAGGILFAASVPLRAAEPAAPADAPLTRGLAHALEAAPLRGARVGALVVDDADGRVVFDREADQPLVPASNLKILTALAALRVFGPAHAFTTRVYADAVPDAEGGVGTLYIRGGGDPGLTSEDYWRLAADLHRAGLRRVRGDLVIDDSLFDGERWHPSWQPTTARAYVAPIGALMANYSAYAVVVTGGDAQGGPVAVAVDPPIGFFRVDNQARTGAGKRLAVDHRAIDGGEEVVVTGAFPRRAERTFQRSVLDPSGYAASVLRLQLGAVGITVGGAVRRAYVPETAHELLAFEGRPLSDVVRRFLKFSNNPIGEALVKSLSASAEGAPGNWKSGVAVVRRELDALGLPTAGLVQVDGSGLSYDDRATPRLLAAAVREGSHSFRFGAEFVASLPIGSTDGTLERRAHRAGPELRAKTGLLTRVTALSGLARRPDGHTLAFSVIVNGFRGDAHSAIAALDAFAAALVQP
ncbi:MAG TPA: D-alanyl-D-alanine carboxypeptidase/D-alanyl-D-alanine-endopeptidase [Myxococcota bacterium]|nr:D-alanyl-D-alanine carboxypeptidase/D-alanyl-D-alanine-endopeptidase [Myxococcota bacterium]